MNSNNTIIMKLNTLFPQAFHYERADVALMGYAKFMKDQSAEEREHAMKLMKVSEERKHAMKVSA